VLRRQHGKWLQVATTDAMSLAGKEWSSLSQAQKDEYKP